MINESGLVPRRVILAPREASPYARPNFTHAHVINTHVPIADMAMMMLLAWKVDIGLPGKGNSDAHGARPVYYNRLDD